MALRRDSSLTFIGFGVVEELSGGLFELAVLDALVLTLHPGLLPGV